jgi:PAS fold
MSTPSFDDTSQAALRSRAQALLERAPGQASEGASAALKVLHELASSPKTADDALKILHELQVHQVELDLQSEALRTSQADLELELARQVLRHDWAPVSCFTVDHETHLIDCNRTGQQRLGQTHRTLLGQSLGGFLTFDSAKALRDMLSQLKPGDDISTCALTMLAPDATPRTVHASARRDPAAERFLVAIMDIEAPPPARLSGSSR